MKNVLNIDVEYIDVAEFVKQRNLTDLEIREKSVALLNEKISK